MGAVGLEVVVAAKRGIVKGGIGCPEPALVWRKDVVPGVVFEGEADAGASLGELLRCK
jgi:hypothetical protein